jgi:hypothetical protein
MSNFNLIFVNICLKTNSVNNLIGSFQKDPPRKFMRGGWEKVSFSTANLSLKGNRKMCSHTFIEVMYYAGQDIFVVAHSRLAYYILFVVSKPSCDNLYV